MAKVPRGSAVARHQVFVLADGEVVVQWTETTVQELLTGAYRPFSASDFGRPISDDELEQLKNAAQIEQFNRQYVWLYAMPESHRFDLHTYEGPTRQRVFYLNTTLPLDRLDDVRAAIARINQNETLSAVAHDEMIAVLGKDGKPFAQIGDAETAGKRLSEIAPELFSMAAVAFVEVNADGDTPFSLPRSDRDAEAVISLDDLIASQEMRALRLAESHHGIVICADAGERDLVLDVLDDLRIAFTIAADGAEALRLLEEKQPDLLVMDLQLRDMHGWQMLARAREIRDLACIHVIAVGSAEDDKSSLTFAAGIDEFLVRPLNRTRLRQSIWMALHSTPS
jgi:CheY-like chemotaxis protein